MWTPFLGLSGSATVTFYGEARFARLTMEIQNAHHKRQAGPVLLSISLHPNICPKRKAPSVLKIYIFVTEG